MNNSVNSHCPYIIYIIGGDTVWHFFLPDVKFNVRCTAQCAWPTDLLD